MASNYLVLAIAMLMTAPGAAQTQIDPRNGAFKDATRRALTTQGATTRRVFVPRGSRKEARVPAAGARLAPGALSAFELRYPGTDHKLTSVGVELHAPNAFFQLADKEPRDFFSGGATWLQAGYFKQLTEIKASGGGDFLIDLPPGPAGHVPLLAGFAFERRRGTDANIRTVAVQLTEGNRLRVALMDDQGADFRGIEQTIASGFAFSGFPVMGGIMASAYLGGEMLQEYVNFDGKRLRQFSVRLQIVWAPRAAVLDMGTIGGQSRRASDGALPAATDRVALRGFRFYFGNSDHHLGAIGVKLQAGDGSDPVVFQDSATDDPIMWSVDYARMR